MKTIISLAYEKILSLFYSEKSAEVHLREICRKAQLNENSAFIYLTRLEKEGFLKVRRDGNLKKYSIRKNDPAFAVFTWYDLQKFNRLPSMRRAAITYFLEKLTDKPVIAFLFGSTAKNTFSEHSDVDLLLVVNRRIETKQAQGYTDSQTAIKIKPLQITYGELEKELKLKEDKVIKSALHTGYPLTNHLTYYHLILGEK